MELDFENSYSELDDDDDDEEDGDDGDELTQASFADFPVLKRATYSGEVVFSNKPRLSDIGGGEEEKEDDDTK